MRHWLATFALGLFCIVLKGLLPTLLPWPACPDLPLLLVLALGLHWSGWLGGFGIVVALGYVSDFASGSLLGEHALLYLLTFTGTALVSRPLNLRGHSVLVLFGALVTVIFAALAVGLTVLLTGSAWPSFGWTADLGIHAIVNGLLTPLVSAAVAVWMMWLAGDGGVHRPVEIEARPEIL